MEKPKKNTIQCSCILYYSILFIIFVVAVVEFWIIMKLMDQKIKNQKSHCYSTSIAIQDEHSINKRSTVLRAQCPPGCRRIRRPVQYSLATQNTERLYSYFRSPTINSKANIQQLDRIPVERGLQGVQGPPGLPGPAGRPGYPGEAGRIGLRGRPGDAGMPGRPGEPGKQGMPGLPGMKGQVGQPGNRGFPGIQGKPGRAGSPGRYGSTGNPGQAGKTGARGYPGTRGSPGKPGKRGRIGERGSSGILSPYGRESVPSAFEKPFHQNIRGDQGDPINSQDELKVKELNVANALNRLKLYNNPNCIDNVNHQKVNEQLKHKGTVTFMVLVDLSKNLFCILHS